MIINYREIVDLAVLLIKQKQIIFSLIFVFVVNIMFAENIDVGIFESTVTSGQIDIKIRPDFDITEDETITAILYTVRWDDPSITFTTEFIFPFFISPQGSPEEYNGYYYQVFAAVPINAQAMEANEEYNASSFTYTDGECALFEIIEDEWTQANNGNVYFEFLGEDVTGIIYEPIVEFGSAGGIVEGGQTINLGETTGNLTLSFYLGNINSWQKRLNEGSWNNIASTSGLINYSEIPSSAGNWEYRCEVQQGSCPVAYSEAALVIVLDTITGISDFEQNENTIEIICIEKTIHLNKINSEKLEGITRVYNISGQNIFEINISEIKTYSFKLDVHGIFIVTYFDKSTNKLHKEKVILK